MILGLLRLGSILGIQESFATMAFLPPEVDPDVIYFEKQLSKIKTFDSHIMMSNLFQLSSKVLLQ